MADYLPPVTQPFPFTPPETYIPVPPIPTLNQYSVPVSQGILKENNAPTETVISTTTSTITAAGPTATVTRYSGPTPNQGAIIALGIVCGLLLLALLLVLVIFLASKSKNKEPDDEKIKAYLDIIPGHAHAAAHSRRHTRTEYSSGGGHDDYTDSTGGGGGRGRRHRRRHSHTRGVGVAGPRLNPGFYQRGAGYGQPRGQPFVFQNSGTNQGVPIIPPVYFPPARPGNHTTGHGQNREEDESTELLSDGTSSNREHVPQGPIRQQSGRRRHSKMSSTESRGRTGTKE